MPDAPTYEQLAGENAELKAVVAELSDSDRGAGAAAGCGLVELIASAVVGCAVGEEAGEEAFVADEVGSQAG